MTLPCWTPLRNAVVAVNMLRQAKLAALLCATVTCCVLCFLVYCQHPDVPRMLSVGDDVAIGFRNGPAQAGSAAAAIAHEPATKRSSISYCLFSRQRPARVARLTALRTRCSNGQPLQTQPLLPTTCTAPRLGCQRPEREQSTQQFVIARLSAATCARFSAEKWAVSRKAVETHVPYGALSVSLASSLRYSKLADECSIASVPHVSCGVVVLH